MSERVSGQATSAAGRSDEQRLALILTDDKLTDANTWEKAYAAVESGGLGERLLAMTSKGCGRKAVGLTVVNLLAAMLAVCLTNGSPNFSRIAEALHSDMPDAMRKRRGITRPWPAPTVTGQTRRRGMRTAQEAVRRRFYALVNGVDVYRGLRHERLDLPELIDIAKQHVAQDPTGEGDAAIRATLVTLMNDLIHGSLDFIPDSLLAHLGDTVAVDGTFVPTFARAGLNHQSFTKVVGKVREKGDPFDADVLTDEERDLVGKALGSDRPTRISTDPEAGHYLRGEGKDSQYKGFGFEAHLCIASDDRSQAGRIRFPTLTVGLSMDVPSTNPGENAIAAISNFKRWADVRGRSPAVGVFDALYPNLLAENFQQPLRQLGMQFIGRLRNDSLGIQASFEGNILVEGTWYCAEMPARLVNASKERVADRITEDEYLRRLEERRRWESYVINGRRLIKDNGSLVDRRFECPASRRTNQVTCPRRAYEEGKKPQGVLELPVLAATDGASLPKACSNRTFQIPAELGLRHEQAHPYMTPEWRARNDPFRSANEGQNGTAKNAAGLAIGTPGRRRVRGLAANAIVVAVQLAAQNIISLKRFLQAAEPDEVGVMTRKYSNYRSARAEARARGNQPKRRRKAPKTELRGASNPRRAASARTPVSRT